MLKENDIIWHLTDVLSSNIGPITKLEGTYKNITKHCAWALKEQTQDRDTLIKIGKRLIIKRFGGGN